MWRTCHAQHFLIRRRSAADLSRMVIIVDLDDRVGHSQLDRSSWLSSLNRAPLFFSQLLN
jgi:hypothetical protein